MATSALALFAEDIKLTAVEQVFLVTLLSATPVAITGLETMVPLVDVWARISSHVKSSGRMGVMQAKETVMPLLQGLLFEPRRINVASAQGEERWASFPLLQHAELINDSQFLCYSMNQTFIAVLENLRATRNLELLY